MEVIDGAGPDARRTEPVERADELRSWFGHGAAKVAPAMFLASAQLSRQILRPRRGLVQAAPENAGMKACCFG